MALKKHPPRKVSTNIPCTSRKSKLATWIGGSAAASEDGSTQKHWLLPVKPPQLLASEDPLAIAPTTSPTAVDTIGTSPPIANRISTPNAFLKRIPFRELPQGRLKLSGQCAQKRPPWFQPSSAWFPETLLMQTPS